MANGNHKGRLPELLGAISEADDAFDVKGFARTIVSKFGGMEGLANELHATYTRGSDNVKTRLMEGILRLLTTASDSGSIDDKAPLEDLENELREIIATGLDGTNSENSG
jgi:hypothetical protein